MSSSLATTNPRRGSGLSSLFLKAAVLALLLPASSALAAYKIHGMSKVVFHAKGKPGALNIEGKTSDMALVDDGEKLTFTVPMTTVTSGIELRDRHMNDEYVQVAQFPTAILVLDRATLQLPTDVGASAKSTVQAIFTVHGVAQPVTVAWSAKRAESGWDIRADFSFDVSRHGITIPSYMGITVDPAMKAEASLHVSDL